VFKEVHIYARIMGADTTVSTEVPAGGAQHVCGFACIRGCCLSTSDSLLMVSKK